MPILPLVCINTKHRTQSGECEKRIIDGWENETAWQVKVLLAVQARKPEFNAWNLYK